MPKIQPIGRTSEVFLLRDSDERLKITQIEFRTHFVRYFA